jgi:hypothetical protein
MWVAPIEPKTLPRPFMPRSLAPQGDGRHFCDHGAIVVFFVLAKSGNGEDQREQSN